MKLEYDLLTKWKWKLAFTALFLLLYGVGMVSVDASTSCMNFISTHMKVYPNGTSTITGCNTLSLFSETSPVVTYHSGLLSMNIAMLGVIMTVIWWK